MSTTIPLLAGFKNIAEASLSFKISSLVAKNILFPGHLLKIYLGKVLQATQVYVLENGNFLVTLREKLYDIS
jgi:hypothetical protein